MTSAAISYNERSWAIDLIGHLKSICAATNRSIRDAGGEQTIQSEGGSLFPDVLLFGDLDTARILQGWELKLPNTSIDDKEFYDNAEAKSRALGLDSFLLWNVTRARLFIRDDQTGGYNFAKEWDELADITTRKQVPGCRDRWQTLATKILGDLNDLFERGDIEGRQFIDAYRSGGITALIMANSGLMTRALEKAIKKDATLRAEATLWWDRYQLEYEGDTVASVLGQAVISNWIGKLLFAHILREKDDRAKLVDEIDEETTPGDALDLFEAISEQCNFWTVFSRTIGLEIVPKEVWNQLMQFNRLLSDLRVGSIDQSQLSALLEATVQVAIRKLRGQYPTPMALAQLLTKLCVHDLTTDRILDPCCGSGTIARSALELKLAAGVPGDVAAESVFAGDNDPQAVQIATFALAKPNLMHVPLRIYQHDVFGLCPDLEIEFRNPTDGSLFTEDLGAFDAITTNLPFVAQAGRARYGNALAEVSSSIETGDQPLSRRADVAAYIPFKLHALLNENGRLGVIITNAWLGTKWGDDFYRLLDPYFELQAVIASGAGRWFQNSDVVTNLLLLRKKSDPEEESGEVKFVVLTRPLSELADDESASLAAAQIRIGQTHNESMTIRAVSREDLQRYRALGLAGNAQFVNCDWALDLPLVPISSIFSVSRGERRGMNSLFYPAPGHGIEPAYIRPLAKGPGDFSGLCATTTREAFSCSLSEAELHKRGHDGALRWIQRFATPENQRKLAVSGMHWYEMSADSLAELVMFINYGSRLFVGRLTPPAFADQRLVRLDAIRPVDLDLCHALLNSTISMFLIEGMGFGRGLGALDLNKDRIENHMHVLDPHLLDSRAARRIKLAFAPLLRRDVMEVADELDQTDRQTLDDVIIEEFELSVSRQEIYDALVALLEIRLTAVE